jgi:ArsR family transcriptional regulator
MKVLTDSGLVMSRKEGNWIRYSNNEEMVMDLKNFWVNLTNGDATCVCNNWKEAGRCD